MPITFQVTGYLTSFTGGEATVTVDFAGSTVRDGLECLWQKHVGLRDRVVTDTGDVRPHVNIFVGDENIRRLDGLDSIVSDGTEIFVLPSVSGGST